LSKKHTYTKNEERNIENISSYLKRNHDLTKFEAWFTTKELEKLRTSDCYSTGDVLCYVFYDYYVDLEDEMIFLTSDKNADPVDVSGYSYYTKDDHYNDKIINGDKYAFEFKNKDSLQYEVTKNKVVIATIPLQSFFDNLFNKYLKSKKIPEEELTVSYENENIKMKIHFYRVEYRGEDYLNTSEDILFTLK